MPKRSTEYRARLLEDLIDPTEAAHYLNAAVVDSPEMLLVALRDVAEAHQMAKVAKTIGVSRESIYRMLTSSGNPLYKNFVGILEALDLTFEVKPRAPVAAHPTSPLRTMRRAKKSKSKLHRHYGKRSPGTTTVDCATNKLTLPLPAEGALRKCA